MDPATMSKEYADRGVQTDAVLVAPSQVEEGAAYIQQVDSADPPALSRSKLRLYNERQIPLGRSFKLSSQKAGSSRLVSLPETVPIYSAKCSFDTNTTRVVSMPTATGSLDFSLHSDDLDLSVHSGELFISDEEDSRIRVQSHATDIPHTPSPPSSPESILIIANKNSLSEGFLRHKAPIKEKEIQQCQPVPDDEGWITWAHSPPRPIPALHGPLSLPYARCPSGAEGTIIEEQETLPRIIWGLEGEDVTSHRSQRSDASLSAAPPVEPSPHTQHVQVPPRLQGTQGVNQRLAARKTQDKIMPRIHEPRTLRPGAAIAVPPECSFGQQSGSGGQLPTYQAQVGYPLRGQEPIDLSTLMAHELGLPERNAVGTYLSVNGSGVPGARLQPQQPPTSGLGRELNVDRQPALQERLRNAGIPSASSGMGILTNLTKLHNLSASSTLALDYLASSRSPIILDPPALTSSHSLPQRMSALEIAQQYRQQQAQKQVLQQQQSLLPTPPNSASPIWSNGFSPYQDSLISPELASMPLLTTTQQKTFHSQQLALALERHHQLRATMQVNSRMSNSTIRNGNSGSLGPAADIQDYTSFLPKDRTQASSQADAVHVARTVGTRSSASHIERSPAALIAPPNTPRNMQPSSATTFHSNRQHPTPSVPLSPTSPKPRLRSFTQQHPRSIPLTKLIQRRLSSVPEEDSIAAAEAKRSPSPPTSHTRHFTLGESPVRQTVKVQLTPPSPLHNSRQPNLVLSSLFPPSDALPGDAAYLDVPGRPPSPQAMVRLPRRDDTGSAGDGRLAHAHGKDAARRFNGDKEGTTRSNENSRGRGARRGLRGKRGKAINGPERVDGGLMVKS